MKRLLFGMMLFMISALVVTMQSVSQPPIGGKDDKGKKGGPPRFKLGEVLPPFAIEELDLTAEQMKEIDAIKAQVRSKLEKILTDEQKKKVATARPPGPLGRGPGGFKEDRPVPEVSELPKPVEGAEAKALLVAKGKLKVVGSEKSPFALTGDAVLGTFGDPRHEHAGSGIRLLSGVDQNKNGVRAGSMTCTLNGLKAEEGRWYRVHIRALAQDYFAVEKDDLYIKVEFFKDNGANSLDFIKKSIYPQVELERKSLADAGTNKSLGLAAWRNYSIDVRTPFPEVDTLQISIGFGNGTGKAMKSEFWVSEVNVSPIPDPADYAPPAKRGTDKNPPALKSLVKLGGRWYYDPRGGSKEPPKQFDTSNVDQLYYLSDKLETPFVGNTSAWLRRGYINREGSTVEKDQFVPDSVVISFTEKHLTMRSKNLPNHPTGVFPDRARFLDGNPNYIQEKRDTWYIPLEPKVNPNHVAMTMQNKSGLPMGPVGVALNGVVFFNPFDHIAEADAVWRLDRCCGHPSPGMDYHYHKYPVCINTPWADDGSGHSPLIGFAFDGFPLYGPYESAGVLAKDSKDNPLNEFNLHNDDARGPHYHVTPGKFPHILGGYWGEVEPRNRSAKKGPPKK
jgi:hypothetical protein